MAVANSKPPAPYSLGKTAGARINRRGEKEEGRTALALTRLHGVQ